jgi:KRAB domain-containing zinc finger protein
MTIKYTRNKNGDFVCGFCNKIVPKDKQNTMHYHLKKHSGDLPYECTTCGKRFTQKQSLELHIQVRHPTVPTVANNQPKEYQCPVEGCHYSDHRAANRRIHFLRKHCLKEINKVRDGNSCKVCNKHCNSQSSFFYHIGKCLDGSNIPFFKDIV